MLRDFDIALIGSGMKGLLQLTKEAEIAIDKSEIIFRLNNHPEIIEFLEKRKPGMVIDLGEEYNIDERRDLIYKRMAERIMSKFKEVNAPVCLVTSGHPTYLVSASQAIIRQSKRSEIKVRVIPGLSSLDNVFADIGFDPGIRGFQSYEATDLLIRNVQLNPDTPLFIWQPGAFQNFFYSIRKSKPEQFLAFIKYLEQFYPPTHPVYVLRTPTLTFTNPECHKISVESLVELSQKLSLLHILFVPPLDTQNKIEMNIAELEDPAYIHSLTEEWPESERTPPERAKIIRDILKRAFTEPDFSEQIKSTPEKTLAEYKLNAYEMEMILSSDERKIYDYLGNERQAFRREYGHYIENLRAAAMQWDNDIRIINK